MIAPELLDILVCPVSQAPLRWDDEEQGLVCLASGLVYPIENDIPVLLPERARSLTTSSAE